MTSVFDPNAFASMTFSEANSTESLPIPAGEFLATVKKTEIKTWQKRDDPSVGGLKVEMTLELEDPAIEAATGRKVALLRHEFLLDLTPEGGLDFGKGKNVSLGRARAACNLNTPGAPFSFDMFTGRQVKATVKHEVYQDKLQARCAGIAGA
jgi:hypothetical protein